MEKTLVLLKPDAVDRGLVGEILTRFERVGLKIVGMKLVKADEEMAKKHYTEDLAIRRGEKVREMMVKLLISGPFVAVVFEGIEAVAQVRKMVGATEPKSALPGTIRGDYAHVSYSHADEKQSGINNLIHASSEVDEAKAEIKVWFDESELCEHTPSYTVKTLG